jgi:hypothetical protein
MTIGSYQGESHALRAYFRAQIASTLDPLRIDFAGEPFAKPTTGVWGRFRVKSTDTQIRAAGSNPPPLELVVGAVTCSFFSLANKGDDSLMACADAVAAMFRGNPLPPFIFRATQKPGSADPAKDDPAWLQINTVTPFTRSFIPG